MWPLTQHSQRHTISAKPTIGEKMLLGHDKKDVMNARPVFMSLGIVLTLCLFACNVTPRQREKQELLVFWDKFCSANQAWLDPQPPAFSYELVIQAKGHYVGPGYAWKDWKILTVQCAMPRNLRLVETTIFLVGEPRIEEWRFFNGEGNRIRVPPEPYHHEIDEDRWLSARYGTVCVARDFSWPSIW